MSVHHRYWLGANLQSRRWIIEQRLEAVERNDVAGLEELLGYQRGYKVKELTAALEVAIVKRSDAWVPCVALLIVKGADPGGATSSRVPFLVIAAEAGCAEIVRELLQAGCDPDKSRDDRSTALHRAAWNAHVDCVRALVAAGADLDILDMQGRTPLILATQADRIAVVEALMVAECDVTLQDNKGRNALYWAARYGNRHILHMLLGFAEDHCIEEEDEDVEDDEDNSQETTKLSPSGNLKDETDIASHKAANHDNALARKLELPEAAAKAEYQDVLNEENKDQWKNVELKPDNVNQGSHVSSGSHEDHVEDSDEDLDSAEGSSCSSEEGEECGKSQSSVEEVDWLDYVNTPDCYGNSPLIIAAERGHCDAVQLLINNGADVNLLNDQRCSAILLAAVGRYGDCVRALAKAGADVNVIDTHGASPLIHMICDGDTIQALLEAGADPDLRTDDDFTPLQLSLYNKSWSSLFHLAAANCSLQWRAGSEDNRGPLVEAIAKGHLPAVKLILHYSWMHCYPLHWLPAYLNCANCLQMASTYPATAAARNWLLQNDPGNSPVSLLFLSRACIRRCLRGGGLSQKVKSLPLPKQLKEFLHIPELSTLVI